MIKPTKIRSFKGKLLLFVLCGALFPALFISMYYSFRIDSFGNVIHTDIVRYLSGEIDKQISYPVQLMKSSVEAVYNDKIDSLPEPELLEIIKKQIRTARYGGNGYFFLIQYDGTRLVAPDDLSQEGTNAWDLEDPNGFKVVRELIKAAKNGGGFVSYVWENPLTRIKESKKSYVVPVKLGSLQAALGTGIYLTGVSEVNREIRLGIDKERKNATSFSILIMAAFILIISLIVYWFLTRLISRPINKVVEGIQQIAAGDLTTEIPIHSSDEIGAIVSELERMKRNFSNLISKVLEASAQVENVSREIALGNQNLSQRTQEQASTLEEISATMEEINSTVYQSASHSKEADSLSLSTLKTVQIGEESIKETKEAMFEISNSSRQIVDIIKVVNDIAFQTNLLALNAAVEAARAGEQGRGFAVVAAEVRNLASRTAESSKQIEQLITESVKRVGKGEQMVQESAKALQQIVENTKRTSDAIAEVATAANEEAAAINQIQASIQQLNQVTQQNAAMVEEIVAASHILNSEAVNLHQMVNQFKINQKILNHKPELSNSSFTDTDSKAIREKNTSLSKDEFIGDGWEKF